MENLEIPPVTTRGDAYNEAVIFLRKNNVFTNEIMNGDSSNLILLEYARVLVAETILMISIAFPDFLYTHSVIYFLRLDTHLLLSKIQEHTKATDSIFSYTNNLLNAKTYLTLSYYANEIDSRLVMTLDQLVLKTPDEQGLARYNDEKLLGHFEDIINQQRDDS